MSAFLGLSAFTRGSSAALVVDGLPRAAAREEAFTREREDARLPLRAARWALRAGGLAPADLDGVVFFEKPLRRFERELALQLASFPRSARTFPRRMALWLGERLWIRGRIATELELPHERVLFVPQARAHAAAAYWPSSCDEAAVLVVDDACESATASLWHGRGAALEQLDEVQFPHSLALFAEAIAEHLGLAGAESLEALADLAAHASPSTRASAASTNAGAGNGHARGDVRDALAALLQTRADGSFALDDSAFRFVFDGERAAGERLAEHLGPARAPGGALEREGAHAALAAAALERLGEALLGLARAARERTGARALCLGGRLALLAPLVRRVALEAGFAEVHVPPEPADGGAALGAALCAGVDSGALAALGEDARRWRQESAALGEELGAADEDRADAGEEACAGLVARLERARAVGFAAGRLELADPPLGTRAMLADPRSSEALASLRAARHLEAWRAPSLVVRRERATELVALAPAQRGFVLDGPLREPWRGALAGAARADGSARVRQVGAADAPQLAALLEAWERASGCPALAAEPLARRGEPPARTAREALDVLARTGLAALALDGRLFTASAREKLR